MGNDTVDQHSVEKHEASPSYLVPTKMGLAPGRIQVIGMGPVVASIKDESKQSWSQEHQTDPPVRQDSGSQDKARPLWNIWCSVIWTINILQRITNVEALLILVYLNVKTSNVVDIKFACDMNEINWCHYLLMYFEVIPVDVGEVQLRDRIN